MLLKEWHEFTKQNARATLYARRVQNHLIFIHGRREYDACDTFGLPYTSSGSYAAIWNTNTDARTKNGLRFEGVAINENGAPVGIFTEYDENENEKNTLFLTIEEFIKTEARTIKEFIKEARTNEI